jgi:hypothetical protein
LIQGEHYRGIQPNEYQKAINNGLAIRDLLLKQVRATKVNWDNPFGDDWEQVRSAIKQINILSMLDKLPKEMRDPDRRWYGILSDICHPNFGSILYVLDHESVREQPPMLALARVPNSHIHLEMTVELVSAPLAFVCLQQISFLSVLDRLLTHYREGIQRFGG